jgi:intein/homing endonuclease
VFDVNSKLKKYGLWICYLDSVKVTNFLIKKTENKTKVPNEIINGNDNIKSSFLQAFFDSEATVGKYQLALNQKDINILRQIRVLCISMGIKPSEVKLYKFNRGKYKGNIYSRMHITHKNNLNKFKNLIGFSIDRKQIKLEGIHA